MTTVPLAVPNLGNLLARNLILSLTGQLGVMVLAFVTTPYIINGLGGRSYGVLMLLSTFVLLLSIQQLGLNAGLIKFVAELFDKGSSSELNEYFGAALSLYLVAGGALTFGSLAAGPWLIIHVFQVPPDLLDSAVSSLYLVSVAFFVRFVAEVFFTIPVATQHVHLATLLTVASEIVRSLGAVWAIHEGFLLEGACAALLVANVLFFFGTILISKHLMPRLIIRPRLSRSHLATLVRYSSSIGIFKLNNHIGHVADKMLIAHVAPIGLLGVYEVCYGLAQKMIVLSGSVVSVIFPAASTLGDETSQHELREVYLRGIKLLLTLIGFPAVILCVFASDLLRHWINREFAQLGAVTLCVLTAALVSRSICLMPHVICQATGHPDVSARFAVYQGVINLILLAALVPWLGILGAAIALLSSELAITPFMLNIANKRTRTRWPVFAERSIGSISIVIASTFVLGHLARPWASSLAALVWVMVLLLMSYVALTMVLVVDRDERRVCRKLFENTIATVARRKGRQQ